MNAILRQFVFSIAFGLCLAAAAARAGEGQAPPAATAADQLWLISTRDACGAAAYWRLDGMAWTAGDAAAFAAGSNAAVPTVFFIHGNRSDRQDAVDEGWHLYHVLKARASRPFRFVIWSWPADRLDTSLRRDVQIKAARSDRETLLLAGVLEAIPSEAPVSVIGYSFGARMAGGALELLAGGCYAGQTLGHVAPPRPAMRAVLVAAAMDNHEFAPGGTMGLAPTRLERALVTLNSCDKALRWYPRLYGRGGPEALGYTGPTATSAATIDVLDVTCAVGRNHAWECYLASISGSLPEYTFLDAAATAAAK